MSSLRVTAAITPTKSRKRSAAAAAVVTPPKGKKTKAAAPTPSTPVDEGKWRQAMRASGAPPPARAPPPRPRAAPSRAPPPRSIFRKFMPGLGHDGVGLYGTLTNATMRRMIEKVECEDRTHVDVGAADGKVLLGAMALGARHAYGLEISGPALADKFHAMRDKLAVGHPMAGEARLATSTDICDLRGPSVEAWLSEVFGAADDGSKITVSAVWHGFDPPAKETLLAAVAASTRVTRFSLIGPAKRDYGKPEAVLDFVKARGAKVELVGDDCANLSGSGESQRVMTFEILR